jgi:hypothetical protein
LTYDLDEQPPSDEDLAEVREIGQKKIKVRRRRAALSAIALAISVALVYPFLKGHMLHQYWDSIGQYLLTVSLVLFLLSVLCAGMLYSAWQALRDVEKYVENTKHF